MFKRELTINPQYFLLGPFANEILEHQQSHLIANNTIINMTKIPFKVIDTLTI